MRIICEACGAALTEVTYYITRDRVNFILPICEECRQALPLTTNGTYFTGTPYLGRLKSATARSSGPAGFLRHIPVEKLPQRLVRLLEGKR